MSPGEEEHRDELSSINRVPPVEGRLIKMDSVCRPWKTGQSQQR